MTTKAKKPVAVAPDKAQEAFEGDLKKVLNGRSLKEAGWARSGPLTLLVPMWGKPQEGPPDFYLLRLDFTYYPDAPPKAQFVNPVTCQYEYPSDVHWLPQIQDNEIKVHPHYQNKLQLICASVTAEFYEVEHGVSEEHIWDYKSQNFYATISAIRRGLRHPHYKGRFPSEK